MTKKYKIPNLLVLILVLASHIVYAQQASILVTIPNPATMVLRSPETAKYLVLNHRQLSAIEPVLNHVEIELWKTSTDVSVQRNQTALTLIGQLKNQLSSVFSPFQVQRYQQIVWQAQGVQSLLDPDLALQVGLTQDQQQRIITALTTLQTTLAQASPNQQAQIKQLRTRAEQESYAALTATQRERLRLLMGVSVDFSRVVERAFKAPEFTGVNTWVNGDAVTLAQLKGKVTIVHFYTYGCINCVRNLPHYNSWYDRFSDRDVQIVGIHRPEMAGEHRIDRVKEKATEAGIQYPVAIDNDSHNWNAWGNHVWPSVYLVDKQGFVRYWWYGEMNWQGTPGETWMRGRIAALVKES